MVRCSLNRLCLFLCVAGLFAATKNARALNTLQRVVTVATNAKMTQDVKVVGSLAYVGTSKGLAVFDVSQPQNPKLLGQTETRYGEFLLVNALAVDGNYAYLASMKYGLQIVDISSPANPRLLTTVSGSLVRVAGTGSRAFDVAVKDGVAFVGTFNGPAYAIDVSNPQAPKLLRQIGMPAWRSGAAVGATDTGFIEALMRLDAGGTAKVTGVSLDGNLLVLTEWNYGRIYYYDVTNARQPVFMGTHFASYTQKALARGDWLFAVHTYNRFSGLSTAPIVSGQSALDKATTFIIGAANDGCAECSFLAGELVPMDMGGIDMSENGRYVFFAGGRGPVGGGYGTVEVVDVSSPANPRKVAANAIGMKGIHARPYHGVKMASNMGMASKGDYIFLASGAIGLQVFHLPGLASGTVIAGNNRPATQPPATQPPATQPPANQPPVGQTPASLPSVTPVPSTNGYVGYGSKTPGGAGKPVVHVTNLNDSGTGSLRAALSAGNRTIVFDVAGEIQLSKYLGVMGSFITLDGFTAPAPGITITRGGLSLHGSRGAHNIIIRGIRIRDANLGESYDGITIASGAHDIVVDHVSVHNSIDGNIDITSDAHDVTISYCILSGSGDGKGSGNYKNMLIKYNPSRITLHHNLFLDSQQRNPQIRHGATDPITDTAVDMRNNIVWDFGGYGTYVIGPNPIRANIVNNFYSHSRNALLVDRDTVVHVSGNKSADGKELNGVGTSAAALIAPAFAVQSACDGARAVHAGAGMRPLDAIDRGAMSRIRLDACK